MKNLRAFAIYFFGAISLTLADAPRAAPTDIQLAESQMAEGEVRKIDLDAGKVTLKHGAIAKYDMPPMTMVFQVKDKSALKDLKVGDLVTFDIDRSSGASVITQIRKR